MKRWMILLAAVLMLLAGCGKEPAVAGLSNEEFHQSFAEDYARPVSNITEITEENGGLMLKTDLGAPITAMKDGTVAWAADVGWNYGYGKMALVQQEDCYLLYAHCSQVAVKTGGTVKQGGAMDAAVTVEVVYIMIELDGKQRVELDKLNNVYKVNGVDLLAKIRKQC